MKKKRLRWAKKRKYWTVEDWQKVLFQMNFFVHGKHSRFVRIRKGEQLNHAHFNKVAKHLPKEDVMGRF